MEWVVGSVDSARAAKGTCIRRRDDPPEARVARRAAGVPGAARSVAGGAVLTGVSLCPALWTGVTPGVLAGVLVVDDASAGSTR